MLIGSLVAGQGTIFLAQTYLLGTGQLELLAAFGTVFSFVTLVVLLIDFGALTTLSRETAALPRDATFPHAIWRSYWSATAVRSLLGAVALLTGLVFVLTATDPFSRWYVLCALPVAIVWPLSAAGLLDGIRLSGASGAVGAAPYVLSSAALLLAPGLSAEAAGAVLGAALAVGHAATVLAQFLVLRAVGHRVTWVRPTGDDVRRFGRIGGAALLTTLPGQLFFRLQLVLANMALGETGTAVFLYAKQVLTGCSQITAMVRRIELPDMTAGFASTGQLPVRQVIAAQWMGLVIATGLGTTMGAISLAASFYLDGAFRGAGTLILAYAPVVVTSSLALMLTLGLIARGRYDLAWQITSVSIALGSILSVALIAPLGAFGLCLAEFCNSLAQIAAATLLLARLTPRRSRGLVNA